MYTLNVMTYMYTLEPARPSYKYTSFEVCRQLLRLLSSTESAILFLRNDDQVGAARREDEETDHES